MCSVAPWRTIAWAHDMRPVATWPHDVAQVPGHERVHPQHSAGSSSGGTPAKGPQGVWLIVYHIRVKYAQVASRLRFRQAALRRRSRSPPSPAARQTRADGEPQEPSSSAGGCAALHVTASAASKGALATRGWPDGHPVQLPHMEYQIWAGQPPADGVRRTM
eukprot:scaffold3473_cov385-Prasinococcus_capsulatus_cf.AAC.3